MAQDKFDPAKFDKGQYDRNEPLDLARFQRTVEQFMVLLRNNDLTYPNDQELLNQFCSFVDDAEIWHLAQTVIPEFRLAKEDQRRDANTVDSLSALDYVLDQLVLLPPPRSDKHVLTSEQDLLNQRHKILVEYVVTEGRAKQAATPAELAECDRRISEIEGILSLIPVQDPNQSTSKSAAERGRNGEQAATQAELAECNRRISEIERILSFQDRNQSTSESAAGRGRNGHQDEVDSHYVSQQREKVEAEKPVGKRPIQNADKGWKKGKANTCVEKGPIDDHFKVIDRMMNEMR